MQFSKLISLTNFAALKAVGGLPDNSKRVVEDTSTLGDGSREAGWYVFRAASTDAESLPTVVEPDDGIGRWHSFAGVATGGGGGGGEAVLAFDQEPDRAPEFPGEIWINVLTGSADLFLSEIWMGIMTDDILGDGSALNVGGGSWYRIAP